MGFAPSYMNRGAEGVIDRISNHNDVWAKMYKCILSPHGYENGNLAPSFHWLTTGLAM
ncbi:MAG: hypothetical protein MJ200_01075 [Mycoplasmoidaceae bacterium]|nr:hypothetical protein [Mycoplasmoidaceae bacterium]